MKIFDQIKGDIINYLKKRYIKKELEIKFKNSNNKNKEYLNKLTELIFKESQAVKSEVINNERMKFEHENNELFADIKSLIEKHYKEKEEKCKKESDVLRKRMKQKTSKEIEFESELKKLNAKFLNEIRKNDYDF